MMSGTQEILHAVLDGRINCKVCNKMFKISSHKTHLSTQHGKGNVKKCEVCSRVFSTNTRLEEHKQDNHAEKKALHICHFCTNKFSQKNNLMEHIRRTHKNKEIKKCTKCEKEFQGVPKLNDHLRKNHLDIKCPKCEKPFTTKSALNRHIKSCNPDSNISINSDNEDPLNKSFGKYQEGDDILFTLHDEEIGIILNLNIDQSLN